MKKNSFIEGTIVAYIMILLTKVLGAIYVIPFYKIIGESGGVLYSYAYNVYNLFLNISTSGIPTAVSIIIAEYNTLKLFNEREKTYKVANSVISKIAIVAFLIMFIFAGQLGNFFIKDIEGSTSIESIKLVIRTISFCILIIPFLSVTRGYLQGNKYVSISSFSQLLEQIVRIFVVLVGSYLAINILHYSIPVGVAFALSGTVISGLVALLYLKYKIHKNKEEFMKNVTSINDAKASNKEIIKKIIYYAIPIIIISISQNIYDMIDMKLIIKGLYIVGYSAKQSEYFASVIITWTPKICMIINALAAGLCTSIIPYIVGSYVKKDYKELNSKFNQAINTIFYITIPLAIFLILNSNEVYYIFYGKSKYGGEILQILAIVSILFSMQLVVNMILQGMKRHKLVYVSTILGFIINAFLDVPLIILLKKVNFRPYVGTLLATMIGLVVSLLMIFIVLKIRYQFKYKSILKTLIYSIIISGVMSVIVLLFRKIFYINTSYIVTFIELAISGLISFGIYAIITYKIGLIDEIFGNKIREKLLSKFNKKAI